MTPIIALELVALGIGVVAIVIAGARDPGVYLEAGCGRIVVTDQAEALKVFDAIAKDPASSNPVEAVGRWLTRITGTGIADCMNIAQEWDAPFDAGGWTLPPLPSREAAAVYLLYLDHMIQAFVTFRPGFTPGGHEHATLVWWAVAEYWQLTLADIVDIPTIYK